MPLFFQQDIDDSTKLAIWKIEEEESFFQVPLQREITHPHKRLQHLAGRYLLKYLFPDFPTELIRIADTRKPFLEDEKYHFSISHCGDYAAVIVSSKCRVGIDVEVISDKPERIMHKFLSAEERLIVNPLLHDAVGQGQSSIVKRESSILNSEKSTGLYNTIGRDDKNDSERHQLRTSNLEQSLSSNPKLPTPLATVALAKAANPQLLTLCWSAKEAMFKWWGNGNVDFSEMLHLSEINVNEEGMIGGRFLKDSFDIAFPVHYKMFDGIVMAWVKTDPGVFDK